MCRDQPPACIASFSFSGCRIPRFVLTSKMENSEARNRFGGEKMTGESPHIGIHRDRKNCLDLTTYSSDHVFIQHALRMPCLSPSAQEVQNPCRQDPPNMTAYVFIPQVLKQVQGSEQGGSRELELATRNQSLVCAS